MAYNVAANLRPTAPGAAFMEGRDRAVQNSLFQQNQDFNQQNTLFNQQRLTEADRIAAQQRDKASQQDEHQQAYLMLQALSSTKSPEQFGYIADRVAAHPIMQKLGVTREDLTPDEVAKSLPLFAAQAGQAPAPPPVQYEQVQGPRGAVLQRDPRTGELKQVVGPDNSQPSPASMGRARTLTAEEVRAKGFPDGSVVQELPDGRLDVVNKRENLSQAEQKTIREAKMRMPRLNATLRRVDRLGQAVESIAKNKLYDGGPADAKVLQYTDQGRELMAASAQVMPELQALTRVPGIGSQSDLEARLASLALPSLEMPPDVNRRSQAELKAFVEDLKSAYQSLLQGGEQERPQQPAPQQRTVVRTGTSNGRKVVQYSDGSVEYAD